MYFSKLTNQFFQINKCICPKCWAFGEHLDRSAYPNDPHPWARNPPQRIVHLMEMRISMLCLWSWKMSQIWASTYNATKRLISYILKKENKEYWPIFWSITHCPNFEGHVFEGHLAKFVSSSACENVSERGEECHEGLRFEIEFP